jgi:hypothetical protein
MKKPSKTIEQVSSFDKGLPEDLRELCAYCPVAYDASSKGFWVRDH